MIKLYLEIGSSECVTGERDKAGIKGRIWTKEENTGEKAKTKKS